MRWVSRLRTTAPEEIRKFFNELAAMDLAEVQGAGSRLTLKSNLLRNVEENLGNVEENLGNVEKLSTSKTYIQQEVEEINHQNVEDVKEIQVSDSDALEKGTGEFNDSEKTSTSSTFGKIEPESLTQQGKKNVEDSSTFSSKSSTFEKSSTFSSTPEEFAEQIRKVIADFDRPLAIKVWNALVGNAKVKLRDEVLNCLAPSERNNFNLLAKAGFVKGMRVKYVGDPKYAEQYEGLELKIYSMNEYAQINCRKPDDCLTTWLKPEELQKL